MQALFCFGQRLLEVGVASVVSTPWEDRVVEHLLEAAEARNWEPIEQNHSASDLYVRVT